MPCRNEAQAIRHLLEALASQTLPANDFEVVIADGMSEDGTRGVIQDFAQLHTFLRVIVVENPDQSIPAGLNRAIKESRAETIIRIDAHSEPSPNYLERCILALRTTGAANVGGVWEIQPSNEGWVSRSIATAAAHPMTAGDARYRTGGSAGEVDTVPFGAFPRTWIDRVGGYDQSLLSNEDYELNVRLRMAGGKIWFDPSIRSTYLARGDLRSLAQQYFRYGFWKAHMLRKHPGSIRWRQIMPPLSLLLVVSFAAASVFIHRMLNVLGLLIALYSTVLIIAGSMQGIRRKDATLLVGFPLSVLIMHASWGSGFWVGLLGFPFRKLG